MKQIYLHGSLATEFGAGPFELDIPNPVMAIRALISRFGIKFEKAIRAGKFHVIRGKTDVANPDYIGDSQVLQKTKKNEIHFIPYVEGSGDVARVVVGIILIVVDTVFLHTGYLTNLGAAMVIGGIAGMLTPKPKLGDYMAAQAPDQRPSFLFNGPVNVQEQGGPVNLVYGRFKTGTTVISAGVAVEQLPPA